MTILYNCKHSGDQYRITKFDDGELISSYLCTTSECDCPAGVRPMCRHREMLPKFINRGAVNTGWMFDYDRGGWVDMRTEVEFESDEYLNGIINKEPHSTTVSASDFDSGDAGSNPAGAASALHTTIIYKDEFHGAVSVKYDETGRAHHKETALTRPHRKPNDGRRV